MPTTSQAGVVSWSLSVMVLGLLLLVGAADGWLGVYFDPDSDAPRVAEVIPGSPAEKAGLAIGDVFESVNGIAVATVDQMIAAVRALPAGQQARLQVRRDGKPIQVVVRIGQRPSENQLPGPASGERPGKPSQPGQPAQPAQPAQPTKPTKPSHPGQPAQPGEPAQSAPPVQHTEAGEPGRQGRPDAEPAPQGRVRTGRRGGETTRQEPGFLGLGLTEEGGVVRVSRIVDGGPSSGLGVQVGEQLVRCGERPVQSLADVDACLGRIAVGDRVILQFRGQAGARSVTVVAGRRGAGREAGTEAGAGGRAVREPREAAARPRRGQPAPSAARRAIGATPAPRAAAPEASTSPAAEGDRARLQEEIHLLQGEIQRVREQLEELRRLRGRGRDRGQRE